MSRAVWLALLVSASLPLCTVSPARATKPAFIPFQELVAKADFVGLVECETAGGLVARYRVIESCRGAKPGETISIRIGVNYYGQQFPYSLCGERYLFTAFRKSPDLLYSFSAATGVPLWWRQLPYDYEVPFHQGRFGRDIRDLYEKAKAQVAAEAARPEQARKQVPDAVWTPPPLPRPEQAQLDTWRKQFDNADDRDEYRKAHQGLVSYDPGPVAQHLLNWQPKGGPKLSERVEAQRRVDAIWADASYFAWRCGQDREKYLKTLLASKEPLVQVAAAVYLCFENEKLGLEELARLTKLESEAGAWAALTRARRGQKDAVPRVLQLFPLQADATRPSHMLRNLQNHALVLLSNSARSSKVAPPPGTAYELPSFGALQDWWQQNAARITLHDPWLQTLSRQKID